MKGWQSTVDRTPEAPAATAARFDDVVLPHLDDAYRLARWLIANPHDAEDVVQEACLRAHRYFRTFSGLNGRAWFLSIVRNVCHGWRRRAAQMPTDAFDEDQHSASVATLDPESLALVAGNRAWIEETLRELPDRFREILVLREIEDLSYRELAQVLGIPIGTVMSGLSRARQAFRSAVEAKISSPSIETRKTYYRGQ